MLHTFMANETLQNVHNIIIHQPFLYDKSNITKTILRYQLHFFSNREMYHQNWNKTKFFMLS